ncbi:TPA: hypothetical protein ACH3X3_002133 [Trebouxia sp. C0006]
MPQLTFEEFAQEYRLPNGGLDAMCTSQLGQGGASSGVERLSFCKRIARATGTVYAVKRLGPWHQIDFPFLLENEVTGLNYANLSNTPRVVKYKELFVLPHGDARIILE